MSKNKKDIYTDGDGPSQRDAKAPSLSEQEVEISLVCLRYFRGDWDLYLDFLQGPRVTDRQRSTEIPLVEQLKDRDRRTDYLTFFVEDEVLGVVQKLAFSDLVRVWEHCLILAPEADPFPEQRGHSPEVDGLDESAVDDDLSTLH